MELKQYLALRFLRAATHFLLLRRKGTFLHFCVGKTFSPQPGNDVVNLLRGEGPAAGKSPGWHNSPAVVEDLPYFVNFVEILSVGIKAAEDGIQGWCTPRGLDNISVLIAELITYVEYYWRVVSSAQIGSVTHNTFEFFG